MLDLVRMSRRPLFPPGGEPLYRQIAVLTGMDAESEVLDVGCGAAVSLEYFVREFGVHGSGIDVDGALVEKATDRARDRGLAPRMQIQQAPADKLPYVDGIFDVTVGELGMTSGADAAGAVRELVRVTRPGGFVVLVQLVWKAPVDEERRRILSDHLGVRPHMLVEWKRLLRENDVGELHTEDWTDPETAFRGTAVKPFPDFSELFSLGEKVGILRRAWGRWGLRGVRDAVVREWEVHRLLTKDRVLGLDLLKGRKAGAPAGGPDGDGGGETAAVDGGAPRASTPTTERRRPDPQAGGLPLFDPDA